MTGVPQPEVVIPLISGHQSGHFQTAAQRIDPDHIIRRFLPPCAGDLLAFAVLAAFIATLLFLPAFL